MQIIQFKIRFDKANLINTQSRLNFILHHTNFSPYINHIHRSKSKCKILENGFTISNSVLNRTHETEDFNWYLVQRGRQKRNNIIEYHLLCNLGHTAKCFLTSSHLYTNKIQPLFQRTYTNLRDKEFQPTVAQLYKGLLLYDKLSFAERLYADLINCNWVCVYELSTAGVNIIVTPKCEIILVYHENVFLNISVETMDFSL